MSNPLLTAEAVEAHQCDECAAGFDCGCDCVESSTCSTCCPECSERIWFAGDWKPRTYTCPGCETDQRMK